MNLPSDPQRELMRQLVEHGGDLATVLDSQFAGCRTAAEKHCTECFSVEVTGAGPLLPPGTESPLCFDAGTSDGSDAANGTQVLLWHTNGQIDGIEISSAIDPHPAVPDLRILASR